MHPPVDRGDPELRARAAEALAGHTTVPQVPVAVDLDELGALGLHHDRDQVQALGPALAGPSAPAW